MRFLPSKPSSSIYGKKPTHEAALMASRSVMKKALIELQFYSPHEEVREHAAKAMEEQRIAYKLGVLRAVD